jgi:hypothetical protein
MILGRAARGSAFRKATCGVLPGGSMYRARLPTRARRKSPVRGGASHALLQKWDTYGGKCPTEMLSRACSLVYGRLHQPHLPMIGRSERRSMEAEV